MKKIDNAEMLAMFARNIDRYFYYCYDTEMAGRDGYKLKEIAYFTEDGFAHLSSFVCVKTYWDDSLVINVNSAQEEFWAEAADFISASTAEEIDVSATHEGFFVHPYVVERLSFVSAESGAPVYGLLSPDDLTPITLSQEVSVSLATEEDRKAAETDISVLDALEEELRNIELFDSCDCFFDTRLYLLKDGEKVIGFLRGECGYRNYYDIGWVYVAPDYRGKGYGKLLTLYFSNDLLKNGLYPHYGYAITPESESVAKACGFTRTRPSAEFKRIKKT